MSIKIVLADDHELMREGLRSLVENEFGMQVIGEAGDGDRVVQLAREFQPDVIIMDVGMPGLDGIDATKQIMTEFPSMRIIALSMHPNRLYITGMFDAGAYGYLLKGSDSGELKRAIETVMAGEVYISPKVAGVIVHDAPRHVTAGPSYENTLTERECEVLRLLTNGKSSKEIALQLDKSIQTIDAHRRQIMEKLQIDNLVDLTKYAIREGLTTVAY
jgi:DNA-binding NarL/FixJ family response regulator